MDVNPVWTLILGDGQRDFIEKLFVCFVQQVSDRSTQNGNTGDDDD